MKKNNGGYSLVELLLTMAIFSVMMLGIVNIMRSTAVVFNSGSDEINVQTEAQIVVNQISDLLADAEYNVSDYGAGYKIEGKTKDYYIVKEGNTIKYASANHGAGLGSNVNWSLMAEYVENFQIDGLECAATHDTGDNACKVIVTMKKKKDKNNTQPNAVGYTYTAKKEVYFRNSIENQKYREEYKDKSGAVYNGGSSNTADNPDTVLDRYEVKDLKLTFGIVSDYDYINEESKLAIQFCDGAGKDYADDTKSQFIICSTDYLTNFDKELSLSKGYGVKGKDKNGNDVQVVFRIKKVNIIKGNGIFTISALGGQNTPRSIFFETEGFDPYSFCGRSNCVIKYEMMTYQDSDGDKKYDSSNDTEFISKGSNLKDSKDVKQYSGGSSSDRQMSFSTSSENSKITLAFAATPGLHGFSLNQANTQMNTGGPAEAYALCSPGNLRLATTIHVLGVNGTEIYKKTIDVSLVTTQTTAKGSFEGSIY